MSFVFNKMWASLAFIVLLSSCGDSSEYLQKLIQSYGYISYRTPLQEAGTGTLVGGAPSSLSLIAHPDTCFPPDLNGEKTELRRRDYSTLPSSRERVSIEGGTKADILKQLSLLSPSVSGNVRLNEIQSVDIQFNGVHVEYMDAIRLSEFYREKMTNICKDYLDQVGFIIQAIRIDQMKLEFFKENQQQVELSLDNIEDILDIAPDLVWNIEQNRTLVIDTPKYIGYQLGTLKRDDEGLALFRATRTQGDKFIFESMDVFTKSLINGNAQRKEIDPMNSGFTVPLKDLGSLAFPYEYL
ncbi:MAG: hypothetical protein AB8G05_16970 [Oligoflexales bacterium]